MDLGSPSVGRELDPGALTVRGEVDPDKPVISGEVKATGALTSPAALVGAHKPVTSTSIIVHHLSSASVFSFIYFLVKTNSSDHPIALRITYHFRSGLTIGIVYLRENYVHRKISKSSLEA